MSQQWGGPGPGQPGFQYPAQTGFGGQPNFGVGGGPGPGLVPQPTGFPGARPGGFPGQQQQFQQQQPGLGVQQTGFVGGGGFQPQQTGFQQQPQFQRPQSTGFQGGAGSGFGGGGIPPVPPLPTGFSGLNNFNRQPPPVPPIPQQQQLPSQPSFLQTQPNRFLNSSPGLQPNVTGYPGGGGGGVLAPLVPQATGFIDPRLQMLSNTFLPANPSTPYNPQGGLQFANGPQQPGSLQQSIQQYNQEARGAAVQKMSWALTKQEKKNYDRVFRSWDSQGSGFLSGQVALEVFGQSGLDKNDLAKIWSLADGDNRGKLNLAEFHVAMGLIYRKLSGNEIPDQLPPELIPPSSRDLDASVNLVRDILKHDTSRSASQTPSLGKVRSFNDTSSANAGGRKDATVYKYSEEGDSDSYYKSSSRHVDRRNVRVGNESPAEDLSSIKRQLEDTASRLDKASEESASRTAQDEALDRELDDLRYRVRRVQEDLEYVSRGPRSSGKDEERRKLERDLLHLLHDKVPEVEKRIEERDRRREREKREAARDRDRRNDRFGRYDERDRDHDDYGRSDYRDRDRDRPYSRGAYDDEEDRYGGRDRDRDREYDRDRDRGHARDRSQDRDRYRARSPPRNARSPPPAAPSAPSTTSRAPAPKPTASPAPTSTTPNLKSMTPDERTAYIREQAQRKLQERMQALGVVSPSASSKPAIDDTVETRLAQDKKEAEEKARLAEKEAEDRERLRRERLDGERGVKSPTTPTPTAPTPSAPAPPAATARPAARAPAPPAPKRAPAPPPPRKNAFTRSPATASPVPPPPAPVVRKVAPAPAPPPPAPPAPPAEDPEEKRLRDREEEIKKQRAVREERLKQLEREEEDARKAEEEYQARRQAFLNRAQTPTPTQAPPVAVAPAPPPPAPPAPPTPTPPSIPATPASNAASTNPFNRFKDSGSAATSPSAPVANGGNNPFFRSQPPAVAPTPPVAPPASKSPAPTSRPTYNTAPSGDSSDWDDPHEKEDSDSSDDELTSSRDTRNKLAQALFGNIVPARPDSAAGGASSTPPPGSATPTGVTSFTPPVPSAPPAPAPPPPPMAPAAPPPPPGPTAPSAPAAVPGDRNALLGAIQGGARLKKAKTNDRSGAGLSGRVLGDATPPLHISTATTASAPEPELPVLNVQSESSHSRVQSVDWYAGLAADHSAIAALATTSPSLPSTAEEDESEYNRSRDISIPDIQVHDAVSETPDLMDDVDKSIEHRVRTLFVYEGQRPEDLSFAENLVIKANPSKSNGDWWYGTLVRDGKSGFFPRTYVQVMQSIKAKALYSYAGGNADELPFVEGDELTIVDQSEADWWKVEQEGVVFIVPAAYVELDELRSVNGNSGPRAMSSSAISDGTPMADRTDVGGVDNHQLRNQSLDKPKEVKVEHDDAGSDTDSESGDSSSEYLSFDSDSDEDEDGAAKMTEEEKRRDREERTRERQKVLEAAGLVVMRTAEDRNELARRKSVKARRPAPGVPQRQLSQQNGDVKQNGRRPAQQHQRQRSQTSISSNKELPPVPPVRTRRESQPDRTRDSIVEPQSAIDSLYHIDDAFERYETFKNTQDYRLSISSFDNVPSSPRTVSSLSIPPRSPSSTGDRDRDSLSVRDREHRHSGLFGFLTRRSTPGPPDGERVRPTISGPMPLSAVAQTPPRGGSPTSTTASGIVSSPSQEGRPVFGSSWASLLNEEALEGIPQNERKRQEAIFELINTEAAYVRDLQLIVEVFYSSMLSLLQPKEITVIFANIEDILLTDTTFLSSLEERQKECRLYIDNIGDLLEKHMARMGVYMQYCVNHGTAINILQKLREQNPELAAQLQRLREDPAVRNLDLSSYLLAPMQRITRYPLLIKQILHYTPSSTDQAQIERARESVEGILSFINESIREEESRARLKEISRNLWVGHGRLDLTAPTRYMGQRLLIKEGPLTKAKSGRKLHAFLCNDILVLTDAAERTLYRTPIPLSEMDVRDAADSKDDLTLRIVLSYPRGGDTIALRTSSPRECEGWIRAIRKAGIECRSAERGPGPARGR